MYADKRRRFDLVATLVGSDVLAFLLSLLLVGMLRSHWVDAARGETVEGVSNPINLMRGIIYGVLTIRLLFLFEGYKAYRQVARFRAFVPVLSIVAGVWLSAMGWYLVRCLLFGSWDNDFLFWMAIQAVIAISLMLFFRSMIWLLIVKAFRAFQVDRVAIVGWTARLERVLNTMKAGMGPFMEFLGFFSVSGNPREEMATGAGIPWRGAVADLERVVHEEGISTLLVDEATLSAEELRQIAEVCSRNLIDLRILASGFDVLTTRLEVETYAGVPVMGVSNLPLERFSNRFVKRAVDIVGATVGLILSAPIILVCGILIYIESPGPIFYVQQRVTRNRRLFNMIKLRSMRLDAEAKSGPVWTSKDDPRRLKIGAFMRRFNLDETPQFWNVLKGEMSLVGPRPERPEFVEVFSQTVRHYNLRHTCKAGMSGWAAVHGLRGDTSLVDRLEYDLYYIENWNLLLDFKVMVMTLFPQKNAY